MRGSITFGWGLGDNSKGGVQKPETGSLKPEPILRSPASPGRGHRPRLQSEVNPRGHPSPCSRALQWHRMLADPGGGYFLGLCLSNDTRSRNSAGSSRSGGCRPAGRSIRASGDCWGCLGRIFVFCPGPSDRCIRGASLPGSGWQGLPSGWRLRRGISHGI